MMVTAQLADAWAPHGPTTRSNVFRPTARSPILDKTCVWMSSEDNESKKDEDYIERTSFDQAGASLIEEEDRKRMEQMGDFDSNESVRQCANLCKLPG